MPTDDPLQDIANVLAERLEGQCVHDLNNLLEEMELTPKDRDDIEERVGELVFCCDGCGWWCSTDELNNCTGENLCDDCDDDED